MQTWNISAGDPLSLTLAADARLANTEYTDDQIWELSLAGGEPAALTLQTTFGLRAHWLRLFPRFVRGETARVDPAGFHNPPRITRFLPNYLRVEFAPFDGLEVAAEYYAAESQLMTGRILVRNSSILPQKFRMELAALLNPMDRQGGMAEQIAGPTRALAGETAYLTPVVYLTGGPQTTTNPYPALTLDLELYPGNERQFSWAAAGLRTLEASLETAKAATARPWEAELARAELLSESHMVKIETGNPGWDAALALAQKEAALLLMKNKPTLPEMSFVLSRRPDLGFSSRGDGSDLSALWSGQTALDSYYLTSLLPGYPELAAAVVRNFIAAQEESGRIDWKPGLTGQRSRRMAQPLLAALALRAAPAMPQPDWFREVFPPLLRFFEAWFSPLYDGDSDGFPEWEHPMQSGLEDSPIYDRWSPGGQGIDAARIEPPALAAMLLRECGALIEMARALIETERAGAAYARLRSTVTPEQPPVQPADPAAGEAGEAPAGPSGAGETAPGAIPHTAGAGMDSAALNAALEALCQRQDALRALLDSTWDEAAALYRYRDSATHLSLPGQTLVEFHGSGKASSRKRLSQPQRLVIHVQASELRTYAVTMTLTGFGPDGEISEVIDPQGFSWLGIQGRATSQNTFLALKRVEVTGLGDEDEVRVATANYTQDDCSLLLPLWAGAPDEARARRMVEETVEGRFLQPFGIPTAPPDPLSQEELPGLHTAASSAPLPWNHLIGEGLLRYGYGELAGELVERLMNAATAALKNHDGFRQYYHPGAGAASGDRGHLHGIAPVGLFLQAVGIRRLGEKEIIVDGFNPFSSPIHVQYRKVRLACFPDRTEITFAGGQTVTVDQPGPHRVHLS